MTRTILHDVVYLASLAAALAVTPQLLAKTADTTGVPGSAQASQSVPYQSTDVLGHQYDHWCACEELYTDGTRRNTDTCGVCSVDAALLECLSDDNCLETCTCACQTNEKVQSTRYGNDIQLTGVPDFWQFNHPCTTPNGHTYDNPVGCAPVAFAEVMYWWAQRGYDHLVSHHYDSAFGHDWVGMVREVREHYLDGGICFLGEGYGYPPFAPWDFAGEIERYAADAGYTASVSHLQVCESCTVNGKNELRPAAALGVIRTELAQGRPVIMGFNVGKAQDSFILHADLEADPPGAPEAIFTGKLSNGTPGVGTISHFAVITGYQVVDGMDVLVLNMGWARTKTDTRFLWNPGGKWLHLFTMDMQDDEADTHPWCTEEATLASDFQDAGQIGVSDGSNYYHPVDHGCGVQREVTTTSNYLRWTETDVCANDPFGHYGGPIDPNDYFLDRDSGGQQTGVGEGAYDDGIADQLGPM